MSKATNAAKGSILNPQLGSLLLLFVIRGVLGLRACLYRLGYRIRRRHKVQNEHRDHHSQFTIPIPSALFIMEKTKQNAQRMQTLHSMVLRDRTSDERRDRTPSLSERANPSNGAGEDVGGHEFGTGVHGDGVHRCEEETHEGCGDGVADERRHKPDDEVHAGLGGSHL